MSSEKVERWFLGLPKIERRQPLIVYGGGVYTPEQVLAEVQAGTSLGRELQLIIEKRKFSPLEQRYALARLRMVERLKKLPPEFKLVVGTRTFTAEELLQEIEAETEIGRKLLEAEEKRLREVLR